MQKEKKIFLPYAEFADEAQPDTQKYLVYFVYTGLFLLATLLLMANAQAQTVQVLHWWTSTSEEKAIASLSGRMAQENIVWKNAVIPSGSGIGAGIVLKSRMLAGDAPEVAQLNGVIISEWADLGLLQELDPVASSGKWEKSLFPTVWRLIQPKGHPVAVPLGIHRINTLFYNRKIFAKFDLSPPSNWDEFDALAKKLQQAGITPLAQSSEPWQLATLFETLVLSESDANFYRDAFVKKNSQAFVDPRFGRALSRLRSLKKYMPAPLTERTWIATIRMLADGDAAMLVMGDWAKGELNSWGIVTDIGFSCAVVPNTANYHLYDIDTLVMLDKGATARSAQEKIAQIAVSPAVQTEYNQIKGSIPVLRNPELNKMDSCSQTSWKIFSRGSAVQVPSLAHRMATDEISKDAIIAEIMRFFSNDSLSVSDTQKRLAAISRTLPK
ncbi:ABC transporter substrate-binding protein [Undibacterium sp. Dicai25W]|uniref:ABC transporter substrate-binding protein n=1 Tax=Undibacterium sp. Dicai25W TaxID=3413034 RepID=UPI003BF39C69